MKVVILGSGVVGVTTAWFLARDGHRVTVIDRRCGPALETSYGNAGLVSPGHAQSWASPKAPGMLLRSLVDPKVPIRLHPRLDFRLIGWGARFLFNCTPARARANTLRKYTLCRYSLDALHDVVAETGIDYHRHAGGILYLHRDADRLEAAFRSMRPFIDRGLDVRVLRRDACVALEPALAPLASSIAGAVLCGQDESGDCHLFTAGLAEACRAAGVEFRFDTTVRRLVTVGANRIAHVETDRGDIAGDAWVVAMGSYSPLLLAGLGIRPPIYPLKGYALTAPARSGAPAMSGVDEEGYVAWSRFGDRLRITSFAELGGYDTAIDAGRVAELGAKARALFPDGADWEKAEPWCGLRPMTPTGMPVIGRSRIDNLWLNTGHGSLGWSMSCGSARLFSDLFSGRPAALDFFPNSG